MSHSQRRYGTIFMAVALIIGAQQANAQVQTRGGITSYTAPPEQQGAVDFINAKPMPLPHSSIPIDAVQSTINALTRPQENAKSGFSPGAIGNGVQRPTFLGVPAVIDTNTDGCAPQKVHTAVTQRLSRARWDEPDLALEMR